MKNAGDAILDDFLETAGEHVKRNAIKLLSAIEAAEESKCFMSDEDYQLQEEDVHYELDKKMLFNIMAIEKIDIELRMLKSRLKNPSILHSAQDFKKDVI
jgi:hypothetical protein